MSPLRISNTTPSKKPGYFGVIIFMTFFGSLDRSNGELKSDEICF